MDSIKNVSFQQVNNLPSSGLTPGCIYFEKNNGNIYVAQSDTDALLYGSNIRTINCTMQGYINSGKLELSDDFDISPLEDIIDEGVYVLDFLDTDSNGYKNNHFGFLYVSRIENTLTPGNYYIAQSVTMISVDNYVYINRGKPITPDGFTDWTEWTISNNYSKIIDKIIYNAGNNISISEDRKISAIGYTYDEPNFSFAEGFSSATGQGSHAESSGTASGTASHAEGYYTKSENNYSHAEGYYTQASGMASHAEGGNTDALGDYSHAEGYYTQTIERNAHSEGQSTSARSIASHAEGSNTNAYGNYSHAEGYYSQTNSQSAHAEGQATNASGTASHAEGSNTNAYGDYSHAEGSNTNAMGSSSHAEGYNTRANYSYQHVQGKYNEALSDAADIVGWGTSEAERKNIEVTKTDGTKWLANDVTCGGTYGNPEHKLSEKIDVNKLKTINGNSLIGTENINTFSDFPVFELIFQNSTNTLSDSSFNNSVTDIYIRINLKSKGEIENIESRYSVCLMHYYKNRKNMVSSKKVSKWCVCDDRNASNPSEIAGKEIYPVYLSDLEQYSINNSGVVYKFPYNAAYILSRYFHIGGEYNGIPSIETCIVDGDTGIFPKFRNKNLYFNGIQTSNIQSSENDNHSQYNYANGFSETFAISIIDEISIVNDNGLGNLENGYRNVSPQKEIISVGAKMRFDGSTDINGGQYMIYYAKPYAKRPKYPLSWYRSK